VFGRPSAGSVRVSTLRMDFPGPIIVGDGRERGRVVVVVQDTSTSYIFGFETVHASDLPEPDDA